jgi:hypothetical protein
MTEKNKPAHKIRGAGGLTVTIWKNDGENGPFYSVTPTRSYKQGEDWKETNSYHAQDLLELAELLREARTWIKEHALAKAAEHSQDAAEAGYAEREAGRRRAGGREH